MDIKFGDIQRISDAVGSNDAAIVGDLAMDAARYVKLRGWAAREWKRTIDEVDNAVDSSCARDAMMRLNNE